MTRVVVIVGANQARHTLHAEIVARLAREGVEMEAVEVIPATTESAPPPTADEIRAEQALRRAHEVAEWNQGVVARKAAKRAAKDTRMDTTPITTMDLADFQQALKDQGVPPEHMACICPMCGTVQSPADFMAAHEGATYEDVRQYVGFTCVGRLTGAPAPRAKPDGKPCNWTLGGFLQTHKLWIRTPDGVAHPHFELATPEQAKSHMDAKTASTTDDWLAPEAHAAAACRIDDPTCESCQ